MEALLVWPKFAETLSEAKEYTDEKIGNLFDPFSESKSYSVGEYVIYNNSIYEFIAAKSAGPWDATKVQKTNFSDVTEGKEDKTNKVITFSSPTDSQYPSAKLVSDSLATTLKEPTSGVAVGKHFRVASIDSSGHPTLEYVDGNSGEVFIATYNTTTAAEVTSAINAGKIVVVSYTYTENDKHWLQLVDETDSKYVFSETSATTANNSTAITGISAALNKVTSVWELVTGGTSIPTFPATIENDKYLHTNSTTGILEWATVNSGVNIILSTSQPTTQTTGDFWYREELPGLYPLGGRVYYDDGDKGGGVTYKFYDANQTEIIDTSIAGLADAVYYSITGTVSYPRYFIYDNTTHTTTNGTNTWTTTDGMITIGQYWGYASEATGATGNSIGSGKTNTNLVLALGVPASPTPTCWGYIKSCNDSLVNGCDDWFIPCMEEMEKLRVSGLTTRFANYSMLTSTEYKNGPSYAYHYFWNNQYQYWNWTSKDSYQWCCFAVRSI